MLNSDEMLVRVWILKIASARIGASESLLIFPSVSSSSPSRGGIEFVTITWSSPDFFMFSRAFPENKPWVANVQTDSAPFYFSTFVASHRVPAVSMMSSMIITFFFYMLPTRCIDPILPAAALCLMIMASPTSFNPTDESRPWKFFALVTPPASGDTTTMSFKGVLFCSTK